MGLKRAVISALIGTSATVLVFGAVIAMNRPVPPPPPPKESKEVSFQLAQQVKPPAPPPPPPVQRKQAAAPAPPSALLSASLAGMSFGLDAFEGAVIDGSDAAGAAGGPVVMTADTVDDPPKAVERVAPEYPVRARARAIEGFVTLSLLVGEDGVVRSLEVLEASPAGVFDEVAREAVRRWRFQPGMYQGQPVAVRVEQTLDFKLE
jgi:protein TonB